MVLVAVQTLLCCLCRFLPTLRSSWFVGCFAEVSNDENDLTAYLNFVCNALSLVLAVVRSADVLSQLCPLASCKSAALLR